MKKIIRNTGLIFITSIIAISILYITAIGFSEKISFRGILNVVIRYGVVMSIPITVFFVIMSILNIKIKNRLLFFTLCFFLLLILFFLLVYMFIWYVGISSLTDNPFTN